MKRKFQMLATLACLLLTLFSIFVFSACSSPCEHDWQEKSVITPAGCTQDGQKQLECSKCQETKTEKIPSTGHKGGEATCTGKAICENCDTEYGELNADNHSGSATWTKTADKHTKKYSCCNAVVVAEENHQLTNGVCSKCEYACQHTGGTATCTDKAVCEKCNTEYGEKNAANHTGEAEWTKTADKHSSKYTCCNADAVAEEEHEWSSGSCTECNYVCEHTGGTATCIESATCTYCGSRYGSVNAANHASAPTWVKTATKHTKTYTCCSTVAVPEENHEWENGVCSECEYACQHTGGEATCTDKAVCTNCNASYGELDADNHTGNTVWVNTQTTHEKKYDCCDNIVIDEENHDFDNGICSECEYACQHTGGEATCTDKAVCNNCNASYGELDADNHTGDIVWVKTEEKHSKIYDCCEAIVSAEADHDFEDGVCTECEKTCAHKGGSATCSAKAICELCGLTYGDFDESNHEEEITWTKTADKHSGIYNCCNTVVADNQDHNFENGVCADCEYACQHTGGEATCQKKAVCEICEEEYGSTSFTNHEQEHRYIQLGQTRHQKYYPCCNDREAEERHTFENSVCTVCGYECTSHSGGTATCKTKAACEYCGAPHGELNASNHEGNKIWKYTSEGHWQEYDCCGASATSRLRHTFEDGQCTVCEYECAHTGGLATCTTQKKCTICQSYYGSIDPNYHNIDLNNWTFDPQNESHYHACLYGCDTRFDGAACSGGTAHCQSKAICTTCRNYYGDYGDHYFGSNSYSWKYGSENGVHWVKCQRSGCDGKMREEECSGGTPTCASPAYCTTCRNPYGETDPTNHRKSGEWSFDPETNTHYYACLNGCDARYDEDECTGGSATCSVLAKCDVCQNGYGEFNPAVHAYDQAVKSDDYLTNTPDCTTKAIYKYSCLCGLAGEETFTGYYKHTYETETSTKCQLCNADRISDGLEFTLSDDETYYIANKGTFNGTHLFIPGTYDGKPVLELEEWMFGYGSGTNLVYVYIADGVEKIGDYCFVGATALADIRVPNSIKFIGPGAFGSVPQTGSTAKAPKNATVSGNGKYIGNETNPYLVLVAATNTSIREIYIHDDTEVIASYALAYCQSLNNVSWGENGVKYINEYAFSNCRAISTLHLPEGLIEIGEYAFSIRMDKLHTVYIPASVRKIGFSAFSPAPTTSYDYQMFFTNTSGWSYKTANGYTQVVNASNFTGGKNAANYYDGRYEYYYTPSV